MSGRTSGATGTLRIVNHENLLAAADVRQRNHHLTVEASRTQQALGRAHQAGGCGNDNDTDAGSNPSISTSN